MIGARLELAIALVAVAAACGGSDDPAPVTSGPASTTAAPGSATTDGSNNDGAVTSSPTTSSPSESTPTASGNSDPGDEPSDGGEVPPPTAITDPFDVISAAAAVANPGVPTVEVGTPDFVAADAIAADLGLSGILPDQGGIWVFPVAGTDERLLVFEVYPAAENLESDTNEDLFEAIVASRAVADAGVTRFVFHYFDTDQDGDFVLTMTVPLSALVRFVTEGAEVDDEVLVERRRVEWSL